MRIAITAATALFLTACSTQPIYLANARGQTAQCGPFPNLDYMDAATVPVREAQCISDFQRQGYERISGKPGR